MFTLVVFILLMFHDCAPGKSPVVFFLLFFCLEAYVHTKFYYEADTTMLFLYHLFMAGSTSQAQAVFILL